MTKKTRNKLEKLAFLREQGDGTHTFRGATYEVAGDKYRQVYAAGHPVTRWRKL